MLSSPRFRVIVPIVKRKRSIPSRLREILVAPLNVMVAWAIIVVPVLLAVGSFAAVVIYVSGEGVSSLWPSRERWIEIGCIIVFVSLIAILLATLDCFVGDQTYEVWVPDTDCLNFSRQFAERLIARDFSSAFVLLATAKQASCPIEDFSAGMTATWKDAGTAVKIESVSEEPLLEDDVLGYFDNCLETGECFDAITRVKFSAWGTDDSHCETACRTLTCHLLAKDGSYRVLDYHQEPKWRSAAHVSGIHLCARRG